MSEQIPGPIRLYALKAEVESAPADSHEQGERADVHFCVKVISNLEAMVEYLENCLKQYEEEREAGGYS